MNPSWKIALVVTTIVANLAACTPAREATNAPRVVTQRALPRYHVTMTELPDAREGAALAAGGPGHLLLRERQPAYSVLREPTAREALESVPCPDDSESYDALQFDCSNL